ncbi:MAG TPA: 2-hydroxyacid dehydrogenase [Verrucomicrobiae bacterium]|nr:2-hydroxyacid dehydrogenase [Verrucomicrobiae bacterium]
MRTAVFDTKPYDREYLSKAPGSGEVEWRFHEFRLSKETVSTAAGARAVCLFVNDCADRETFGLLKSNGVQMVAMRCAGFNNVDVAAAKELAIPVVRVPSYSPHAVAEHAVALCLTLNRKIHRAYNRVREHNFSLNGLIGFDLAGKTVGVIGTGKIGKIAAQIFRGFDMRALAYDPYPAVDWAKERGVEYVDLEKLMRESDIVTLHLPLTAQTNHLLNAERLAMMKQGAMLINTSRGKLIDTPELVDNLLRGHLGGVALDVYEEEEGIFFEDHSEHLLQDDTLARLLSFPNVLITSHQAFLTREALLEIARVTAENLARFAAGKPFIDGTTL